MSSSLGGPRRPQRASSAAPVLRSSGAELLGREPTQSGAVVEENVIGGELDDLVDGSTYLGLLRRQLDDPVGSRKQPAVVGGHDHGTGAGGQFS